MYDTIQYGYTCLRQFPKSEKFTMVADIKNSMYTLLKLLIRASKKYYKKNTLQDADIELQYLKTMIRLASELKTHPNGAPFLSIRQYEIWAKQLDEIGRMLGQWIKSSK